MPSLSVIIPTHERSEILSRCIAHLEKQTIADRIEVIVIGDGHDDATTELFARTSWKIPVSFEEIPKSQQGTARNRGVAKASSPVCLFIGDDIFLDKECCALHESIHRNLNTPVAVLGMTQWDPAVGVTEAMDWLVRSGWQFGYPKIDRYAGNLLPKEIQHLFSYTSNLSVPTETARNVRFLEEISLYGWEDVEWGTRLAKAGIPVFYEPNARALHHHKITMEESIKRMETLGESVVRVQKIAPDFDRRPKGWKRIAYEIFAKFPTIAGRHRAAFLRGIRKAESSEA